jgi:PAS domain S-box-containing protein
MSNEQNTALKSLPQQTGVPDPECKSEEGFRQDADEWKATFDSITDLVSLQDSNFRFQKVNKAFADAFGMRAEDIVGMTCYKLVHGTEHPPPDCPHQETLRSGKPHRAEFFEPHLGVYLEVSTSPVFAENGDVAGSVHIAQDITWRKQAEQKQAKLLTDVESISRELKDFAYIVSHDLKAPLRGIKSLVEWISADYADKLDENGREQMKMLQNRVERMHNLIEGVLQYSRVSRDKGEHASVNLNELVPQVIDSIAPPENVSIKITNDLPTIQFEPTRITQVFQNLLGNAVKYTDKPQGQVTIWCAEEDGCWKFSICDNGPGIDEKHFERIFQMFQTLCPRDQVESTGVGLTIVRKIVEMYGGKIWVESKLGEGSTFYFTIPTQKEEPKDEKTEANTTC